MSTDLKEIEELTWKAINKETKKIHDRDQQLKNILSQTKIEHIGV
jgi:hypothetical protein